MNYFKKTFLAVVVCTFAVGAKAQAVDNHVYETDELNCTELGMKYNMLYTKVKNIKSVDYSFNLYFDNNRPSLGFDADKKSGLISTTTKGIVKNVSATWYETTSSNPTQLFIYTRNKPYNSPKELHEIKANEEANLQGGISEKSNSIDLEAGNYYIGIIDNGQSTWISTISVTWQLAHIRESLTPSNLGTICLPYAVEKEDMQGIKAYSIAGKITENGVVTSIVLLEETSIEAGMPYVFIPEEETICLKYSGAKVTEAKHKNGLYGALDKIDFSAANSEWSEHYYIFKDNGIHGASQKSGVNANRAYIRMNEVPELSDPVPSNRRAIIISEDGYRELGNGQPTSINEAAISRQHNTEATYDIVGRQASALPSVPQIMIQNGKKVIPANR